MASSHGRSIEAQFVVDFGNRGKLMACGLVRAGLGGASNTRADSQYRSSLMRWRPVTSFSAWTCLAQNFCDPSREAVVKHALKIGFFCRQERKISNGLVALNV
jgi:hypothetical protein